MYLDDTLIHIIAVAVAIAAFLLLVAYVMAASGEFNDTHFGRAIFYTTVGVSGVSVLVHELAPNILRDLGITTPELALYAIGVIVLAGVCGAILDAVSWLIGR